MDDKAKLRRLKGLCGIPSRQEWCNKHQGRGSDNRETWFVIKNPFGACTRLVYHNRINSVHVPPPQLWNDSGHSRLHLLLASSTIRNYHQSFEINTIYLVVLLALFPEARSSSTVMIPAYLLTWITRTASTNPNPHFTVHGSDRVEMADSNPYTVKVFL